MRLSNLIPLFLLPLLASTGCQFMPHSMQPNQLWKMNRQDAWDEGGYFSVSDPARERFGGETVDHPADESPAVSGR